MGPGLVREGGEALVGRTGETLLRIRRESAGVEQGRVGREVAPYPGLGDAGRLLDVMRCWPDNAPRPGQRPHTGYKPRTAGRLSLLRGSSSPCWRIWEA